MCDCPSFRLASRRRTGVPLIGLLASLFFSTHALAAESPPPVVPLFNGKTLDGWTAYAREPAPAAQNLFEVIDGTLHAYPNAKDGSTQPIGYVVTNAEYANYRLSLEYKWGTGKFVPRAEPDMARDAGVLFHVHSPNTIWPAGAECQIQEGDTGDAWLVHTRATSRVHPDTMGYWPAGLRETAAALLLTAGLFLGPLFEVLVVDAGWRAWLSLAPLKAVVTEWTEWRNIVAVRLSCSLTFDAPA